MPRPKRSEKIAVAVKTQPQRAIRVAVAEKVVAGFCPVCLVPNTKILCPRGYIDIVSMLPGDKIMGLSTQAVEATYSRAYNGKVVKLKPRYLPPVTLTADHPILVATLHEVYGSRAKMEVGQPRAKIEVGRPYWKRASDIEPNSRRVRHGGGDCVLLPKFIGEEKTYLDIESFSRKRFLLPLPLRGQVLLTKDLAELFGWYVADGSASKKEVVIYLNVAESEKLARVTELVRKLGYTHYLSQKTQGCYALHINTRVLGRFFKHWFGDTAKDKRIPPFMMVAQPDLIGKFLDGYFAGDGYYRKNRREANTVSESLALGLQLLSFRSGLPLGISEDGHWECRSYIQGRRVNPSRIRYCLAGTLGTLRKRKYFEDDSFYYLPVVKKEVFDYVGQVYNLKTTEGIFLTPFVVHNCGRTVPAKRAIKIGRVTVDWVRYFDSIDWQPDKPFGVAFLAGGRGSFRDWEHIGPEDAPELFEAMKKRFIEAVHEWLAKGWLTEKDLGGEIHD